MLADQLTKILPRATHEYLCKHYMSVIDPDADPFSLPKEIPGLKAEMKKQTCKPTLDLTHALVAIFKCMLTA